MNFFNSNSCRPPPPKSPLKLKSIENSNLFKRRVSKEHVLIDDHEVNSKDISEYLKPDFVDAKSQKVPTHTPQARSYANSADKANSLAIQNVSPSIVHNISLSPTILTPTRMESMNGKGGRSSFQVVKFVIFINKFNLQIIFRLSNIVLVLGFMATWFLLIFCLFVRR